MEDAPLAPRRRPRPGAAFDAIFPLAFGFAAAALAVYLQLRYFPIGDIDLETDFYGDLVIGARHLAEGRISVADFAWKGPFYAVALTVTHALCGDWYRGAVLLSALAGGAYLALAYRLVLRLFDRRAAFLTTLAAALVVEFFVQFHRATTDVLFLFVSLGSTACTLRAAGSWRWHVAAGGLAALAFLTRYNGIYLLGGAVLALFAANPDRLTVRRRTALFGLYVATFLLVCTPWFAVNWMQTGRILSTRNVENIISTFYGGPRWQDEPVTELRSLPAIVAHDPVHFATRFGRNLAEHAARDLTVLLGWPLALIPLAGILGVAFVRPSRRQLALYMFGAVYWFFMAIVFWAPRFSLPLVLPYLAFGFAIVGSGSRVATRGGASAGRRVWIRRCERPVIAILVAAMLGLVGVQVRRIVACERMIHGRRPLYVLQAAAALAQHPAAERPRLLARKGHLAYHAGFDYSPYSDDVTSLEELVRYSESVGAQYIAYSKIEYSMLPRMLFLAVTDTVPRLEEVYRGSSLRVFRLGSDAGIPLSDPERYRLLEANRRAARSQRRPAAIFIACEDLGMHHMRRHEFSAAAAFFREALAVAEGDGGGSEMERLAAVARLHLARAHLELGERAAAIALLERNLELPPGRDSPRDVARTRVLLERATAASDAAPAESLAAP